MSAATPPSASERSLPHSAVLSQLASSRPQDLSTQALNNPPSSKLLNVPNTLTGIRFLLAIAVMVLIPMGHYFAALVIFVVAASTDWMDGYWARKYNQVTKFGRIFDPFVDKIIICGTFIALVGVQDGPVMSWMATLVVARELLVTSLRGMIEGSGKDFSAKWLGKWKMVLQCAAVIVVMIVLWRPDGPGWLGITADLLLWSAIALTIYSGYDYCVAAARIMKESPDPTE